jgi:hypothetical protein
VEIEANDDVGSGFVVANTPRLGGVFIVGDTFGAWQRILVPTSPTVG